MTNLGTIMCLNCQICLITDDSKYRSQSSSRVSVVNFGLHPLTLAPVNIKLLINTFVIWTVQKPMNVTYYKKQKLPMTEKNQGRDRLDIQHARKRRVQKFSRTTRREETRGNRAWRCGLDSSGSG
jgi:hypothetical protein